MRRLVGGYLLLTLGALAGGAQTAEGTVVAGGVLLVLALELLHAPAHEAVVEVFTTQVRVSAHRGRDFSAPELNQAAPAQTRAS